MIFFFDSANITKVFCDITRKNINTGKGTCIDNICTNMMKRLISFKKLNNYGLFDHDILFAEFAFGSPCSDQPKLKKKN